VEAVEAIGERGIDSTVSLKLSQLGLTVDRAACAANLNMILERAKQLGVGVEVDMEQSELVDATLELFRRPPPATRRRAWRSRCACAARWRTWSRWRR
jgi:proline dehydrogenase